MAISVGLCVLGVYARMTIPALARMAQPPFIGSLAGQQSLLPAQPGQGRSRQPGISRRRGWRPQKNLGRAFREKCNHYRLILACMLSGVPRSSSDRGLVDRTSWRVSGNSRRNWQPARACWQGSNHHAPNRGRNRVDHRTIAEHVPGVSSQVYKVAMCVRCGAALSGTGRNSRAYYKLHYVR